MSSKRAHYGSMKEFERLANRVVGWLQNALIGTFLGGLRADISTDVQALGLPVTPINKFWVTLANGEGYLV